MVLDTFRLDGQVAIVTGSRQGIGQAMALALAEAGADVASFDRNDPAETRQAVEAAGRRHRWEKIDMLAATAADLQEAVGEVVAGWGRLDILVNNAGIIRRAPALEYAEADWDDILQIDLKSVFFLAQAAARAMLPQKRGKIINLASMLSFQGGILSPAYAAAKSGVVGITRALANEWARHGINVNAIAPGYIATEVTTALRHDPVRSKAILDRIPADRWGAPGDFKGVVVFLASAASDYLHGAIVPVDGGWLAR